MCRPRLCKFAYLKSLEIWLNDRSTTPPHNKSLNQTRRLPRPSRGSRRPDSGLTPGKVGSRDLAPMSDILDETFRADRAGYGRVRYTALGRCVCRP
jgi:hypothetical protein